MKWTSESCHVIGVNRRNRRQLLWSWSFSVSWSLTSFSVLCFHTLEFTSVLSFLLWAVIHVHSISSCYSPYQHFSALSLCIYLHINITHSELSHLSRTGMHVYIQCIKKLVSYKTFFSLSYTHARTLGMYTVLCSPQLMYITCRHGVSLLSFSRPSSPLLILHSGNLGVGCVREKEDVGWGECTKGR